MPNEPEPVSLPEPVPADERAARRTGTVREHALVGRIDRLAGAVECLIDVALDIDLPKYADGRSCIGGANYGDALRALHASSRALRAVRDQIEAYAPNDGHGGPKLSKSELISHFRCGLSYGGSNTVQTCIPPIELGTFNGVQPLQGSFEWVGEVTVSVGGYLTLLGAGFTDEEGRVVTVTEAEIELLPA